MKNYSVYKKGSISLAGFTILIFFNYAILQSEFAYKSWVYATANLAFLLGLIYLYRHFFETPLKTIEILSRQVVGDQKITPRDELSLAIEAIQQLTSENKKAIAFIDAIRNAEATDFNDSHAFMQAAEGSLGHALVEMQKQLKAVAEKEKERTWVTEKLALFSEIFRNASENLPELCSTIVSSLVKQLEVNQGAIFILNDEKQDDSFLEMAACYAYDRKKHLNKQVAIGEGLLGQTFLEKESIYLTDIPQNYTTIRSGLGDATPTCLLIVPIRQNDEVLGLLEIASFKKLLPYQMEFVEKMSEGLASAIATARISERTAKLLHESQTQTQELKAQEEEMRQNMEELQATQEASYRMQEELRINERKQLEKIEELSQARQIMQQQEAKLKESQEKAQRKSLMFKEKMESLDIELEGKKAEIKKLLKQIESIKETN